MTTTHSTTGKFATAIATGRMEVNPHMTPEQEQAFASQVEFWDRATARGIARVEAERCALIASGRMTEDGQLIDPPALR